MSGPVVDLTPGRCTCGCGESAKARFRQGHDQRLKGILGRAHRDGVRVSVQQGRSKRSMNAVEAAAFLDTSKYSWSAALGSATPAKDDVPASDQQLQNGKE